jgi:hypothetical protein
MVGLQRAYRLPIIYLDCVQLNKSALVASLELLVLSNLLERYSAHLQQSKSSLFGGQKEQGVN